MLKTCNKCIHRGSGDPWVCKRLLGRINKVTGEEVRSEVSCKLERMPRLLTFFIFFEKTCGPDGHFFEPKDAQGFEASQPYRALND